MEVYCSVQQIKDEATQIKLASLRLAGTTLIWWKNKLQNGTQQVGNVFPSWKFFISALRKQFYPLVYKHKDLIEWQILKLRKGQIVQEYTDGIDVRYSITYPRKSYEVHRRFTCTYSKQCIHVWTY
jgi:hypothetical protein